MRKTIITTLSLLLLLGGMVFANGQGEKSASVGAKNFTEQYIMGHMISLLLEDAGFSTSTNFGLSSNAVRNALTTGQIDMYAEYTGTAWVVYLDHDEQINDPVELYEAVKEEDLEQNDIVWLDRIPVNNTYALAVKQEFADEHDLDTLTDLAELVNENPEEYSAAIDFEFFERPDGFPALMDHYDMNLPENQVNTMEIGLSYEALNRGDVQIAMVFATDGKLRRFNLKVLEDDENFFTPYNLAVSVRQPVLEQYPEIEEVLAPLADILDQQTMTNLNYQVDAEEQEPEDVAQSFLEEQGLLE
jgi:osmoprotectant transport system substrate-binding protein